MTNYSTLSFLFTILDLLYHWSQLENQCMGITNVGCLCHGGLAEMECVFLYRRNEGVVVAALQASQIRTRPGCDVWGFATRMASRNRFRIEFQPWLCVIVLLLCYTCEECAIAYGLLMELLCAYHSGIYIIILHCIVKRQYTRSVMNVLHWREKTSWVGS